MWVYDDGAVKGIIQVENQEIKKLFVEPVLQGKCIGSMLLKYVINYHNANVLWALEKNTTATQAIGYKEMLGYLRGEMSFDDSVESLKIATRKYAKRQMTWFRRDKDIEWFTKPKAEEVIAYLEQQ